MKVTISLTGGLGNQLFQLAAGLNFVKGDNLYLSTAFGKPRINEGGDAEIFSFRLPTNVMHDGRNEAHWLVCKIARYFLGISAAPKRFKVSKLFVICVNFVAIIPLVIFLKEKTSIIYSKNLGYSKIKLKNKRNLVFGYFQSYFWVENLEVKSLMMDIYPKNFENEIKYFKNLADIERPLVVHVRLSDYLNEKGFGIPTLEYYSSGIKQILETSNCNSIWLFSDDLELARNFLPADLVLPIRLIGQVNNSTALTFEIMRLGYGYVIANSTFSWWAAYLSRNLNSSVVSPDPWFTGIPEPTYLIPKGWKRIQYN
jgi:hypothetical protein